MRRQTVTLGDFRSLVPTLDIRLKRRTVKRACEGVQRVRLTICAHDTDTTPWSCGCMYGCPDCALDTRCTRCGTIFNSDDQKPALVGISPRPTNP